MTTASSAPSSATSPPSSSSSSSTVPSSVVVYSGDRTKVLLADGVAVKTLQFRTPTACSVTRDVVSLLLTLRNSHTPHPLPSSVFTMSPVLFQAINMSNTSFVSLRMLNQAPVPCSVACLPPPSPLPPLRLLRPSASRVRRSRSFASIVLVVLSMHCFSRPLLSRQRCNAHGLTALLLACRCVPALHNCKIVIFISTICFVIGFTSCQCSSLGSRCSQCAAWCRFGHSQNLRLQNEHARRHSRCSCRIS